MGWRLSFIFICSVFWLQINQKGEAATEEPERPGAIVSNHVSYLDILYHMSASFPSFVAKRSVGKLPLVGLISKCLGCVYVQREAKSPDFKGVSGMDAYKEREILKIFC
jgi:lysophosphatidylcholine acyltransferase/lyso-PAF acetyltransferase